MAHLPPALNQQGFLDSLPDHAAEQSLLRLTALASMVCQMPIACICLMDDQQQHLLAQTGWPPAAMTTQSNFSLPFNPYVQSQVGIFAVPDALRDDRFRHLPLVCAFPYIRSYVGVPLCIAEGLCIGVLAVLDHQPRALKPSQQDLLAILANQAVLYLGFHPQVPTLAPSEMPVEETVEKNWYSHQILQERLLELETHDQRLRVLQEFSTTLQAAATSEDAYRTIAPFVSRIFPNSSGTVALISKQTKQAETIAQWGTGTFNSSALLAEDCPVIEQQCAMLAADQPPCRNCRRLAGHPLHHACVPVLVGEKLVAVLSCFMASIPVEDPEYQELLTTLAQHIGLTLGRLHQVESLQQQTLHDHLTGLFNRRHMEEALKQCLRRARYGDYPVSVIMLDIDYFKRFNDTFGHQAGDRILKDFSVFLKGFIRGTDIACRYGGEEFLLILPNVNRDTAFRRADRIRQGVQYLNMRHGDRALGKVTISAGVAVFPEHGLTDDVLLEKADKALYRAKSQGRDRVVIAN
jgi:diguanylate cyclase (GGDEF)-like protein